MAEALRVARNADLRPLAAVARDRYDRLYSPGVVHAQLVEVYEELCGRRAPASSGALAAR